ncbi:AraC family transcriptional regulator [Fusicatenibacter sp.]
MSAEYFVFVIISFFLKTLYPIHRNTSNFSSPSHFQTAFKKQFDMTPNDYRRRRS